MILQPTLETLRLLIRSYSMDDLQPMHRLLERVYLVQEGRRRGTLVPRGRIGMRIARNS
jgi:hypothetical protein